MVEFSDFIEDLELIDLPLEGGTHTWFRGDTNNVASRIDRILFTTEWSEQFSKMKQVALQRLTSDHVPIALHCGPWDLNKSYFKFENWWLNTEGFIDKIRSWWEFFCIYRKPDYILACKLKALKGKLKEWSKEEKGNLLLERSILLNKMATLDSIIDNRALTGEEAALKAITLLEYEELLENEETAWRQRSRILWLKEGDNNTKFFHNSANAHKRSNCIDQLEVQGETVKEPDKVKKEIIQFYKKLYTETERWRLAGNMINCPTVSPAEKVQLQAKFEEEVLSCLKKCAIDKSPGPDGYTMGFFIKCWEVLKHDIMNAFHNFYEHEIFERASMQHILH
uniref:Putative ovule protein n=1 Tax=Solanum chacoense TaxID=4108 RepID=A0A0V0HVN8_SOLCH